MLPVIMRVTSKMKAIELEYFHRFSATTQSQLQVSISKSTGFHEILLSLLISNYCSANQSPDRSIGHMELLKKSSVINDVRWFNSTI